MDRDLHHIRELWSQEADKYILKTIQDDIDTYDTEIRGIIIEEASQRGLIRRNQSDDECDSRDNASVSLGQGQAHPSVVDHTITCLDATEGVKDSCYCPNCKSIYPEPKEYVCPNCNKDLELSGYCEKCDKFWPRPPGELCPCDQTKLIDHKRSFVAKYLPLFGKASLFILFFSLRQYLGTIGFIVIGMLPCMWIVDKALPLRNKGMLLAICWQISTLLCGVVACVLLNQSNPSQWAEAVFFGALLVWLVIYPSIFSVMALTAFHVLSMVAGVLIYLGIVNVDFLDGITLSNILVNATIRCFALIFMVVGLKSIKNEKASQGQIPDTLNTSNNHLNI